MDPDVAERVVDRLTEVGLLDDVAYAEMFVRSRHQERGLARRALAHELRARGIDEDTARQALDQVDEGDEHERARALVHRRLPATRGLDRQVRVRRLAGMLARKGYPSSVALAVVHEALDDEDADSTGGGTGW